MRHGKSALLWSQDLAGGGNTSRHRELKGSERQAHSCSMTKVPEVWVCGSSQVPMVLLQWGEVSTLDLPASSFLLSSAADRTLLLGEQCCLSSPVFSFSEYAHCALWLFHSSGSTSSWTMGTDDSPNVTDDAADEIMERIVKSATQVPSQRVVPRERKRSRANRKSRKCLFAGVRNSLHGILPSRSV